MSIDQLATHKKTSAQITEWDVVAAQKAWGDALVELGQRLANVSVADERFALAEELMAPLYQFVDDSFVFKPTMAYAPHQFRLTAHSALSYFVGSDHDDGFAAKMWSKVEFNNARILCLGPVAVAMGVYYFTPPQELMNSSSEPVEVEYTFVYTGALPAEEGLKIVGHHSSLPYTPQTTD